MTMSSLPSGYEPHELPADYTGPLWIEGQIRAYGEACAAAERERTPLTDEQILTAAGRLPGWLRHHEELDSDDLVDFARAIEHMHDIKETP